MTTESIVKYAVVVNSTKQKYDVYIGRPSKWGNPYTHKRNAIAKMRVGSRKIAIQKYREYILTRPDLLADLHELKGKVLGCWCKPGACHGDVLIQLMQERGIE